VSSQVPFLAEKLILIYTHAAKLPLILLAENDLNDVFFMRRALQRASLANPLFVARDGQVALDYISGDGPYADRRSFPAPSLLLLDLNMPRVDGLDVLAWLHSHPEHNGFPIVVLSSSDHEDEVRKAKALGALDYRVKPLGVEGLVVMLLDLHGRWLNGSRRPTPHHNGAS
jgi:CheY-like chemotaxis protein